MISNKSPLVLCCVTCDAFIEQAILEKLRCPDPYSITCVCFYYMCIFREMCRIILTAAMVTDLHFTVLVSLDIFNINESEWIISG